MKFDDVEVVLMLELESYAIVRYNDMVSIISVNSVLQRDYDYLVAQIKSTECMYSPSATKDMNRTVDFMKAVHSTKLFKVVFTNE
jgi:hypothetical protein